MVQVWLTTPEHQTRQCSFQGHYGFTPIMSQCMTCTVKLYNTIDAFCGVRPGVFLHWYISESAPVSSRPCDLAHSRSNHTT